MKIKTLISETLANSKKFTELRKDIKSKTLVKDFEDLFKFLERNSVDLATVDLGYMNLREFNETFLSKVLKEYEIPYFTIELPYYVKDYLVNQIIDSKNKYNEIKSTLDILTDKNSPAARELSFLMNFYSNEIKELKFYINQKIRIDLAVNKIINITNGFESKDWNLIHFGKKSTFKGINNQLKERNIDSKILTIDL